MPPRRPCNGRSANLLKSSGKGERCHLHVYLHFKAVCLKCGTYVPWMTNRCLSGCLQPLLCSWQKPLTSTFSTTETWFQNTSRDPALGSPCQLIGSMRDEAHLPPPELSTLLCVCVSLCECSQYMCLCQFVQAYGYHNFVRSSSSYAGLCHSGLPMPRCPCSIVMGMSWGLGGILIEFVPLPASCRKSDSSSTLTTGAKWRHWTLTEAASLSTSSPQTSR